MNQEPLKNHQEKLDQFKQAIQNNTFSINSDSIASALLEAQKLAKQNFKSVEQPEIA
ncbi:MAG: flagellar biosynthesis anti-sigma factor FlgM [Legionellaceae bacterium]|nr:flagellar biosynthesis anti-sigma factor FlgM [Legionellaceae bacterium]